MGGTGPGVVAFVFINGCIEFGDVLPAVKVGRRELRAGTVGGQSVPPLLFELPLSLYGPTIATG